MTYQPTVVLDFDKPIHSYSSGWTGYTPDDPPTPGALEFIQALQERGFRVVIVSSRCDTEQGLTAVRDWLEKHGFPPLEVSHSKVPAIAYVDDRAVEWDPARDRGWDYAMERILQLQKGKQ